MRATTGATLKNGCDYRGAASSATAAGIWGYGAVVNGRKARNGGRGAHFALGRQGLEQIANAILDLVAGGFTGQHQVADIAPIALRRCAVTSDHTPERTAGGDVLGLLDVVGATETDDAFVTVLNVERAIAQVLGFHCGGQQK